MKRSIFRIDPNDYSKLATRAAELARAQDAHGEEADAMVLDGEKETELAKRLGHLVEGSSGTEDPNEGMERNWQAIRARIEASSAAMTASMPRKRSLQGPLFVGILSAAAAVALYVMSKEPASDGMMTKGPVAGPIACESRIVSADGAAPEIGADGQTHLFASSPTSLSLVCSTGATQAYAHVQLVTQGEVVQTLLNQPLVEGRASLPLSALSDSGDFVIVVTQEKVAEDSVFPEGIPESLGSMPALWADRVPFEVR